MAKTAEYLMPSYFCRNSNDLDILSWWWYNRAYTQLTLHHCYFTVKASASMQTAIPVSSPGDLQSLRPLDMIHGTSLRGRQEDEEISFGRIQGLLTLLLAASSLHKGLHIWGTLKFPFAATAKNSSEVQYQIYKNQFCLSGFNLYGAIIKANAPLKLQKGSWWWKMIRL